MGQRYDCGAGRSGAWHWYLWTLFSWQWPSVHAAQSAISEFFKTQSHVILFCGICGVIFILFVIICVCCRCSSSRKHLPLTGAPLLDVHYSPATPLDDQYQIDFYRHEQHHQLYDLSFADCYYCQRDLDEDSQLLYYSTEPESPQVQLPAPGARCQRRRFRITEIRPNLTRLDMAAAAAAADAPPAYPGTPSPRTLQVLGIINRNQQTSTSAASPVNVLVHSNHNRMLQSDALRLPTSPRPPFLTPPPNYLDAIHLITMQRADVPAAAESVQSPSNPTEQRCCPNHEEIRCSQV